LKRGEEEGEEKRREEKRREAGTHPHADHELSTIHEWEIDSVDIFYIGKRGGVGVHPIIDGPIRPDESFIHQKPEYEHRPAVSSTSGVTKMTMRGAEEGGGNVHGCKRRSWFCAPKRNRDWSKLELSRT